MKELFYQQIPVFIAKNGLQEQGWYFLIFSGVFEL